MPGVTSCHARVPSQIARMTTCTIKTKQLNIPFGDLIVRGVPQVLTKQTEHDDHRPCPKGTMMNMDGCSCVSSSSWSPSSRARTNLPMSLSVTRASFRMKSLLSHLATEVTITVGPDRTSSTKPQRLGTEALTTALGFEVFHPDLRVVAQRSPGAPKCAPHRGPNSFGFLHCVELIHSSGFRLVEVEAVGHVDALTFQALLLAIRPWRSS